MKRDAYSSQYANSKGMFALDMVLVSIFEARPQYRKPENKVSFSSCHV